MEDAPPLDRLTKADPAPLLVGVAEQARAGEAMMARAVRAGRPGKPVVALMRSMSLPRASRRREASSAREVPRLLDTVVPGFGRHLRRSYPGFRRPGTMLLPVGVRMPVLAGVA